MAGEDQATTTEKGKTAGHAVCFLLNTRNLHVLISHTNPTASCNYLFSLSLTWWSCSLFMLTPCGKAENQEHRWYRQNRKGFHSHFSLSMNSTLHWKNTEIKHYLSELPCSRFRQIPSHSEKLSICPCSVLPGRSHINHMTVQQTGFATHKHTVHSMSSFNDLFHSPLPITILQTCTRES